MADDAGIKIDGKRYEIPTSLRVGETRTIKRMTGMDPPKFMAELANLSETQDPDVGAAMVWWIMHREDPSITPEQIDELEWGAIEGEGGGDPKETSATSVSASEITSSSSISAERSSDTSGDSGETIPTNGGGLTLAHSGLGT